MTPRRKILDFRPSAIVTAAFSEYRARIPRIMQTARLVIEAYIHACKHSSVIKGCVCWSVNRTQFAGLLVRQSRIFRVCGVIAPLFLNHVLYRETYAQAYAQEVQYLKRLLGKGKCQNRRVTESVLCDPRCLESL